MKSYLGYIFFPFPSAIISSNFPLSLPAQPNDTRSIRSPKAPPGSTPRCPCACSGKTAVGPLGGKRYIKDVIWWMEITFLTENGFQFDSTGYLMQIEWKPFKTSSSKRCHSTVDWVTPARCHRLNRSALEMVTTSTFAAQCHWKGGLPVQFHQFESPTRFNRIWCSMVLSWPGSRQDNRGFGLTKGIPTKAWSLVLKSHCVKLVHKFHRDLKNGDAPSSSVKDVSHRFQISKFSYCDPLSSRFLQWKRKNLPSRRI